MGDIVSVISSVLSPAFNYLAAHSGYICKFDENLNKLKYNALEDLEAKRVDVEHKVEDGERRGGWRLDEVERWLSEVKTILHDANKLVSEAYHVKERRSSCGCCSNNIISTYRCGKKITTMLSVVKNYSEKVFEVVTRQATPPVVEEEPVQQTFGLDAKLEMAWNRLKEDGTRMLGLYGMGGVGKTTLLSLICNRFSEVVLQFKFYVDVVIWVSVSKDVDIMKIQDDIAKRVGFYDENWCRKTQREKRDEITRVLKVRKFVLLLDDLWEKVSLSDIGIPLQQGKEYKIVFTTRSIDVCQKMFTTRTDKENMIEVKCLADKDALDLLKHISGRDRSTGEMLDLAEKIVKKCHGLPLALQVIGKCLSSKPTGDEWRKVLDRLSSYPDLVEGMENKMFAVLKVSYDYLEKEDEQSCFLYCALFPEAYKIKEDELVEYWIGENIIDVIRGRERAEIRGDNIINTLVGAGLLLKDEESKQKVYMPNMIREMALWIASAIRDGKMFIVKTNAGLDRLPHVNWTIVSKMSLMYNEIKDIPDVPEFPDQTCLITLFLQNNRLEEISYKFFVVMSTLVVLDLSSNPIIKLPDEISELVSLRFLKLLGTRIMYLPEGFSKLVKLIHLDLEYTNSLCSISQISGLLNLEVLRFYGSAAALDISLLKNLEGLIGLQLLTITVREVDVLKAFLGSNVLPSCTQGLYLDGLEVSGVSGKSFASTFGGLGSLSKLHMTDCDIIESETEWEKHRSHQCSSASPSTSNQRSPSNEWFKNLSAVVLHSCENLKDLTWLIYAANLESLSVKNSPKMNEVISQKKAGDVEVEPFQKLQVLDLGFLNELESIYWTSLFFPRLQQVNITECWKLRKLPLKSTSVARIDDLLIEVDDGWLDGVEWESGAEERFRHAFFHTASVSSLNPV